MLSALFPLLLLTQTLGSTLPDLQDQDWAKQEQEESQPESAVPS